MILQLFGATALLIDKNGTIFHVAGRTGKYLEATTGPFTQNVLDLVEKDLKIELALAIRTATAENRRVTRENIQITTRGEPHAVNLHVCPLPPPPASAGRFVIVFEETSDKKIPDSQNQEAAQTHQTDSERIAELEKELTATREKYQTAMEEYILSNRELTGMVEAHQTSNEELQSANEELESSKEELQLLNEELRNANCELQEKMEALSDAREEMENLLDSMEMAVIFVDNDLCVKKYTPAATAVIHLLPSDIGRPLNHLATRLKYKGVTDDLETVLRDVTPKETLVQVKDGTWYGMHIVPYRKLNNRIDGAVLTFTRTHLIKDKGHG